ncbi:MAG: restriction endonuclease subunit S [Candidatus Cloacimonetes bacterium]|nr:restriction endonuclease subunit S [Candidatus Cloacimonadota bacterium]
MSEWKHNDLGQHVILITKGTTPMSLGRSFQESGINFIKAESITDSGRIIRDSLAFIDHDTHSLLKRSQLISGDVLFSIAGVLGRVTLVGGEFIPANINQALALIRVKDKHEIDRLYLKYYLTSDYVKQQVRRINVQAAQANFSLADVNGLLVRYPKSIEVQRKIATILSTIDKVIEKTEAAIEKYKAIKAGMMQDLFTRGIDTQTGKLRPTFEEAPELYKESELGWIPKEWEAGRFGDICKVKAGYSFKSSEFGSNGYRLIRISNIQEYTVKNLENDVFITPNLSTQEYELKLGDLLIALSGATTGKVGLVKRESLPALLNQRVGLFEPQDNTSIDYVYQIVSDDSYQKSILDNCPSSAQPNVSPKYLEAVLIKYAKDQHEQALIVRLLKSIDSTIEAEYNQLKKSLKLKQGLMADLLSGKVRVNLNHDKVENR